MAVTQSHPSKINLPERSPGFTVSSNASVSPRTPRTPPPTATRLRGYPLRRRASSISSLRSSVSEASVESSELDWSTNEDDNLHRICDEYANESTHTPYADCAPPNQLVHHLAKTARKSKFGPENDRWRHTLRLVFVLISNIKLIITLSIQIYTPSYQYDYERGRSTPLFSHTIQSGSSEV